MSLRESNSVLAEADFHPCVRATRASRASKRTDRSGGAVCGITRYAVLGLIKKWSGRRVFWSVWEATQATSKWPRRAYRHTPPRFRRHGIHSDIPLLKIPVPVGLRTKTFARSRDLDRFGEVAGAFLRDHEVPR